MLKLVCSKSGLTLPLRFFKATVLTNHFICTIITIWAAPTLKMTQNKILNTAVSHSRRLGFVAFLVWFTLLVYSTWERCKSFNKYQTSSFYFNQIYHRIHKTCLIRLKVGQKTYPEGLTQVLRVNLLPHIGWEIHFYSVFGTNIKIELFESWHIWICCCRNKRGYQNKLMRRCRLVHSVVKVLVLDALTSKGKGRNTLIVLMDYILIQMMKNRRERNRLLYMQDNHVRQNKM